jgi:hypothetical protein
MTLVWDELQELLQKIIKEKDLPQQKFATEALVYSIEEIVDEHTTDLVELRNRIIKLEQNSSNISPVWEQLIKDLASRIRKLELNEKSDTSIKEIEKLLDQIQSAVRSDTQLGKIINSNSNRIRDLLFVIKHKGDKI